MARRSGSRLRTALKFPLVPRAHPHAQKLRLIATRAEAVSRKASSISGLLVLETIIAHRVSYYTKHRNRKQSTKPIMKLRLVNFLEAPRFGRFCLSIVLCGKAIGDSFTWPVPRHLGSPAQCFVHELRRPPFLSPRCLTAVSRNSHAHR